MSFLSDRVVSRLRKAAAGPAIAGERYVVVSELGRGGMGCVWLAYDDVLRRDVAVKMLDADHERSELEARMRDEAHILARLEHPGIVPIHDLGLTVDGRLFYVMKRVEGKTLDVHLERVIDRGERLRIFERLCDPVAFAHARGIVHRDLKPANIMVGSFGEVLVLDWGVAKIFPSVSEAGPRDSTAPVIHAFAGTARIVGHADRTPTHAGTVLGTRGFMSPEQEGGEAVDARADVYSLGAILLRILDDSPVSGDPRVDLDASKHVPRPLRAIVARALAPHAADRYADARALADDVARYRDGRPVAAYRESLVERVGRWVSRYRVAVLLVVAYLIMRAIVAVWIRQRTGP